MMRVQIVRDIRIDPCPGAERLELALGLGHVGREEAEIADGGGPHLGIVVGRVVPLVAAREGGG